MERLNIQEKMSRIVLSGFIGLTTYVVTHPTKEQAKNMICNSIHDQVKANYQANNSSETNFATAQNAFLEQLTANPEFRKYGCSLESYKKKDEPKKKLSY